MSNEPPSIQDFKLVAFIKARIEESTEPPAIVQSYRDELEDGWWVYRKARRGGLKFTEINVGPWTRLASVWRDHPDFRPEWDRRAPFERD